MSIRSQDLFTGTADTSVLLHTSDSGHTWANAPWAGDNPAFISGLGTLRSNNGTGGDGVQQLSHVAPQDDMVLAFRVVAVSMATGYVAVAWDIGQTGTAQMYKLNLHPDGSFYLDRLNSTFVTLVPTGGTLNGSNDGVVSGLVAGDTEDLYVKVDHLTSPTRTRISLYDRSDVMIGQWIDTTPIPATRRYGVYQQDGASTDLIGIHIDNLYLVDDPHDVYPLPLSSGTISEVSHGATTAVVQSDTAASGGTGPITYRWQISVGAGAYSDIPGATSVSAPSLVGLITPGAANHLKRIAHTTVDGDVDSNVVTFTANAALSGGTISIGVVTTSSVQGVSSSAASGGSGTYSYQWQIDLGSGFVDISGATTIGPASKSGLGDDLDFPMRRRTTDTAEGTVAYSNTITPHTDALPDGSFSIDPGTIPANHAGDITLALTGSGTTWDGSTVFTPIGVTGLVKVSQNVIDATHAEIVVTTGAGTGTAAISDGTESANVTVAASQVSVTPTTATTGVSVGLTFSGVNTVWSQEPDPDAIFSVDGGVLSNVVVTDDETANGDWVPDAAGVKTFTDESTTGATDTVSVSDPITVSSVLQAFAHNQEVTGDEPVIVLRTIDSGFWNNTLGATEALDASHYADYEIPATLVVGKEYYAVIPAGVPDGIYYYELVDKQGVDLAAGDFEPEHVLDVVYVTIEGGEVVGWGGSGGGLSSPQAAQLTAVKAKTDNLPVNTSTMLAAIQAGVTEAVASLQNAVITLTDELTGTIRIYTPGTAQTSSNLIRTIPISRESATDPFSFNRVS